MSLADYLQHILAILEEAGHPAIPLDSRMGEPADPGLYYTARWERVFLCSPDHEHGVIRAEFLVVESGLADALRTAEEVRSSLSEGLGMRLAECAAASLEEGERAIVRMTARCFF